MPDVYSRPDLFFHLVEVGYAEQESQGRSSASTQSSSSLVRSIVICAGSGGSMLLGKQADVYFTGEMSHVSPFFHLVHFPFYSPLFCYDLETKFGG
jgi:hypothetical protein